MYHARATVLREGRWVRGFASCLAVLWTSAGPLRAQEIAARTAAILETPDSADVVASDAYLAGGFHRFLLGGHYRRVWATPIRVPVLDLQRYAGGLTPKERGGGFQTRSLQLTSADGR